MSAKVKYNVNSKLILEPLASVILDPLPRTNSSRSSSKSSPAQAAREKWSSFTMKEFAEDLVASKIEQKDELHEHLK